MENLGSKFNIKSSFVDPHSGNKEETQVNQAQKAKPETVQQDSASLQATLSTLEYAIANHTDPYSASCELVGASLDEQDVLIQNLAKAGVSENELPKIQYHVNFADGSSRNLPPSEVEAYIKFPPSSLGNRVVGSRLLPLSVDAGRAKAMVSMIADKLTNLKVRNSEVPDSMHSEPVKLPFIYNVKSGDEKDLAQIRTFLEAQAVPLKEKLILDHWSGSLDNANEIIKNGTGPGIKEERGAGHYAGIGLYTALVSDTAAALSDQVGGATDSPTARCIRISLEPGSVKILDCNDPKIQEAAKLTGLVEPPQEKDDLQLAVNMANPHIVFIMSNGWIAIKCDVQNNKNGCKMELMS
jgi:hypothetical protein